MKYWRFYEKDTGEGQFMHYLTLDEAFVFIDVHYLISCSNAKDNAKRYKDMFSRDVSVDYTVCMGAEEDDSARVNDFVARCLLVFGFQDVQAIESDKELEPIYRLNEETQEWMPWE